MKQLLDVLGAGLCMIPLTALEIFEAIYFPRYPKRERQ